jgi:hypothetical protein
MIPPVPPQPDRPPGNDPGGRRRAREERQDAEAAQRDIYGLLDQALGRGAGRPRLYARVRGIYGDGSAGVALYAYELAVPADATPAVPLFTADAAAGRELVEADPDQLPAWETSGNTRVPLDGSAFVELQASAGGLYYSFTWPERYTPARLAAAAGSAGSTGGPVAHRAVEQLPGEGGHWADMPGGREFDPCYEANGRPVEAGSVVFVERGYALCPDVVTAIVTHGDDDTVSPVHSVYLENVRSGTWALTLFDGSGNSERTAQLPGVPLPTAAEVEDAITALDGWGSTSVTGAGTPGNPYLLHLDDTFRDVPVTIGDPFALRGVQEWFFHAPQPAPCNEVNFKVEDKYPCEAGRINWYQRTLTYLCGALVFPLPRWEYVAQIGCCPCDHGSTGSLGSTGSGSGGCSPPASLCARVTGAGGNCACATGSEVTMPAGPPGTAPGRRYTGSLTLYGCAGAPTMALTVDYYNDGINWRLRVEATGCGFAGPQEFSGYAFGDCLAGLPQSVAVNPPNSCCGTDPMDAFFIEVNAGPCGGGSGGSGGSGGGRFWCVSPTGGGSTGSTGSGGGGGSTGSGGGGSGIGSAGGGLGAVPLTAGACSVSCQPEAALTGAIRVGGAVTWDGGACAGVITAGPFASPDCGGGCGGSGGSIDGPCCEPLPDLLHVTFGGMLASYGSVPVRRETTGLSRWIGPAEGATGDCGPIRPLIVECSGGLFNVRGLINDLRGNAYAAFTATAAPDRCAPLDVSVAGGPATADPPGSIFLTGGGEPICPDMSPFSARVTV